MDVARRSHVETIAKETHHDLKRFDRFGGEADDVSGGLGCFGDLEDDMVMLCVIAKPEGKLVDRTAGENVFPIGVEGESLTLLE